MNIEQQNERPLDFTGDLPDAWLGFVLSRVYKAGWRGGRTSKKRPHHAAVKQIDGERKEYLKWMLKRVIGEKNRIE